MLHVWKKTMAKDLLNFGIPITYDPFEIGIPFWDILVGHYLGFLTLTSFNDINTGENAPSCMEMRLR